MLKGVAPPTVVLRRVAMGTDDPWSSALLGRELLRHHRVPAAGEETAAARVLPRRPVSDTHTHIHTYTHTHTHTYTHIHTHTHRNTQAHTQRGS